MNKKIILTALIFGIVSIVLGAFGAHALKKMLSVDQLASFEVAVKYLMYEAFFLLFIGTTALLLEKQKRIIFYFALFGSVLFSGSIFLLTTKAISGVDFKFLGPITPIGGLLIIVSWGITFYYIVVKKV